MIDIGKGRYWDLPWSLVDGCTPCSPGCDRCWSAEMARRFRPYVVEGDMAYPLITDSGDQFNGRIRVHSDRLSIPLKRKKPAVYAVWNDLHHKDVPYTFRDNAYWTMLGCDRHTYLILTKRPEEMLAYLKSCTLPGWSKDHIWHGLTVCNQQEADEKIPIFLQIPGKKFLSIEPMLGRTNIAKYIRHICGLCDKPRGGDECLPDYNCLPAMSPRRIDAVVLGGETGPGARPINPSWVRAIREQCKVAGVPFYFKHWGEWAETDVFAERDLGDDMRRDKVRIVKRDGDNDGNIRKGDALMRRVGKKAAGRLLDGRTHDDLPWVKP